MPQVVYYVACSVDGFVADRDGGVGWLPAMTAEEDFGYHEFFESVDALVMGSRTYLQALEFGAWPYTGPCWVMSGRRLEAASPAIEVTALSPRKMVKEAAQRGHDRLWLVGGPTLAGSFQELDLIDEYWLTVIPTLLGGGVPLLAGGERPTRLTLIETRECRGGVVQHRYRRAPD